MKKIHTISIIAGFVATMSIGVAAHAASFEPVSRTYYVEPGTPVEIVNNNENTNINNNIPAARPVAATPVKTVETCANCGSASYRLVKTGTCGQAVAYADAVAAKPTCSLTPTQTAQGNVKLTWHTNGATVAYIDNGIGNVTLGSGSRIVTPHKSTSYVMTVLNENGVGGSCVAKVTIDASYTVVRAPDTQQAAAVSAVNTNSNNDGAQVTTEETRSASDTESVENGSTTSSDGSFLSRAFSNSTFRTVAIPVIIVFAILMLLLFLLMRGIRAVH